MASCRSYLNARILVIFFEDCHSAIWGNGVLSQKSPNHTLVVYRMGVRMRRYPQDSASESEFTTSAYSTQGMEGWISLTKVVREA